MKIYKILRFGFFWVFALQHIAAEDAHDEKVKNKSAPVKTKQEWNYRTMREYVGSTEFFKTKPCIVFRDIWEPEWTKTVAYFDQQIEKKNRALEAAKSDPSVAIPSIPVELQVKEDVKTITLHHAQMAAGTNAADIKNSHTAAPSLWSDIGYHYVVAQKPEAEPFLTKKISILVKRQVEETGNSPRELRELITNIIKDYEERRALFEKHKTLALKDPRNKDCQRAGEDWLIYEGRAERFQGSHAGNAILRYDAKLNLFEVVHPEGDEMQGTKFTCTGKDCPPRGKAGKLVEPLLESLGFVQGAYYKYNPSTFSLDLVNRQGKVVKHPETAKPQSVSLKSREKAFKVKEGQLGTFKDGENVKLSYNYGSLGVVIAGTYHPNDEKEKIYYGYDPGDPEWKRQPPQEAVNLVGQVIQNASEKYPIEKILAHRSGELSQKHNCSGGDCPGEGAIQLLNAYYKRFIPRAQK